MKRFLDITIVVIGLIFLSPFLIITFLLVKHFIGSPVIFKQTRSGLKGKPFNIYKFRSMTNECDSTGCLLSDNERLNPFGRWLRSLSLDELPELINVLKGEMSLVGPRPLLMRYLDRYTPEQARRHEVKPGLTGWAQVNGRNSITWDEKFKLDVWYVDHPSIKLDLKIIALTIINVLKKQGITQEGQATVEEFFGSEYSKGEKQPATREQT
jgi:sugar transferase EpsL